MKKVIALILVLVLLALFPILILTGCAEVIGTTYETVQVEIIDARRWWTGKTFMHRVTVGYDDFEYRISGSKIWRKYKDKVGETVPATLKIRTYDDGTIKRDIVCLGEDET